MDINNCYVFIALNENCTIYKNIDSQWKIERLKGEDTHSLFDLPINEIVKYLSDRINSDNQLADVELVLISNENSASALSEFYNATQEHKVKKVNEYDYLYECEKACSSPSGEQTQREQLKALNSKPTNAWICNKLLPYILNKSN